jgi:hypothetical protein
VGTGIASVGSGTALNARIALPAVRLGKRVTVIGSALWA